MFFAETLTFSREGICFSKLKRTDIGLHLQAFNLGPSKGIFLKPLTADLDQILIDNIFIWLILLLPKAATEGVL